MTCRSCGATIADKAIVCYRCGTPTDVPAAPARTTTRAPAPWGLVGTALMAAIATVALAIVLPAERLAISVAGAVVVAALGAWALLRWPGR